LVELRTVNDRGRRRQRGFVAQYAFDERVVLAEHIERFLPRAGEPSDFEILVERFVRGHPEHEPRYHRRAIFG
jgi:hypothetical protein